MEIKNNVTVQNFLDGDDLEANKQRVLEVARENSGQDVILSSNYRKEETINHPIVLELLNGKEAPNITATETLWTKLHTDNFDKVNKRLLRDHAMAIAGDGPINRQAELIDKIKDGADGIDIKEVAVKNRKLLAVVSNGQTDKTLCKLEYGAHGADVIPVGADGSVLNFNLAENDLTDKLTKNIEIAIYSKNEGKVEPREWDKLLDLNKAPDVEELLNNVYDCPNSIKELSSVLDDWFRTHGYRADHISGEPVLVGRFEYKYVITFGNGGEENDIGELVIAGVDEGV